MDKIGIAANGGAIRVIEGLPVVRAAIDTLGYGVGKSGTTSAGRAGFQHVVSEVSLGHAGLILGAEMARLARSGKDWRQLLELCAPFGTLLADLDGIYDPATTTIGCCSAPCRKWNST
jgi:DNA invertase Pin-like site-specific DNA recombinase